jgi:hypothetical protein
MLAGVFTVCVLAGLLYARALLPHFFTGLPYTHAPPPGQELGERIPGDSLQFYYHLWLLHDGLFGPTPAFTNPYEFAWDGPRPGWMTYFLPISLVFLGLAPLGTLAAYNGFVLLSFGLAGLAMYLLARELAGGGWPALVAGLVFALAPYRYAVLMGGHPAGTSFFLVPLALVALERAIRTERAAFGLAAGLAVLSLALVEPHYVYFLVLLLPLLVAVRLLPPLAGLALPPAALRDPAARRAVAAGLPAVGLVAAAGLPVFAGRSFAWPAWLALWAGVTVGLGLAWLAIGLVLARLRDAPLPDSLKHALWGLLPLGLVALSPLRLAWDAPGLTRKLLVVAGSAAALVWLGLVVRDPRGQARLRDGLAALRPLWPLALGLLGAVAVMLWLRHGAVDAVGRGGRPLREIALFSPVAQDWLVRFNEAAGRSIYPGLMALALAGLGLARRAWPRARDAGRWVAFLVGLFLVAEVLSLGPNGPWLYAGLYELVPYFGFMRQTSKFQVLAFVALSVLAALGVRALGGGPGARPAVRFLAGALAAAAIVWDYWPARPVGVSLLPAEARTYEALRAPGNGRVVFVPIWPGDSSWASLYQYAATRTRRPMLNGYSPLVGRRYVDEVYWPLDHLNRGEITEREFRRLHELGVRFLVVDRGAFPPKVSPFSSGFTLNRLRASPYVDLALEDPPFWLFALRDTPRPGPVALPTTPYGIFFEAERLPRRVGGAVEDPEASWGRAVTAREGAHAEPAGFVVFGARAGLPRGSFRVIYRLRGHAPGNATAARIEAVTDAGRQVLAARTLAGRDLSDRYADHALDLTLGEPTLVELRVFWAGRGELAVDYFYGLFANQTDPPRLFASDDFGFGHGPFRRFPPGDYVLTFRTRVDDRPDAPVARFTIATAHERAVLATRTVRGVELERVGAYQELALPVRVERLRVLEILIDFLVPGVSVDQIRVMPAG